MIRVATYSIAACDLAARQWGVAVQSKFLAAASVVSWAEPEAGAVATQAYANPRYGPEGLALLRDGLSAEETVRRLTEADDGREHRQVGIVDRDGGSATFTGSECLDWAGGRTGPCYAAQGNILVSAETVDALAETFEGSSGKPLAERLLDCLAAAQEAGGDRRGQQAAGLLVVAARRRLCRALRRRRRSARGRPRAPDRGAAANLRDPPAAVRQDPAGGVARRGRGAKQRAAGAPGAARFRRRARRRALPLGAAARTWRSGSRAPTASTRSCLTSFVGSRDERGALRRQAARRDRAQGIQEPLDADPARTSGSRRSASTPGQATRTRGSSTTTTRARAATRSSTSS